MTGGTGFVGSHLVESLLKKGYDVSCLVRSDEKWLRDLNVTIVRGDLTNKELLRRSVAECDYIYHVAAVTRAKEWSAFQDANVAGTLALARAAAEADSKLKNLLITSSLAVVGEGTEGIATEETPLQPVSLYGRSKKEMEESIEDFCKKAGLPYVVVRPPSVYGPRERDIFTFFQAARRGIGPFIGQGQAPEISLVHVDDLVGGMIAAAESDVTSGKVYFLGDRQPQSWHEIIAATEAGLGRRVRPLALPEGIVRPIGAISEWVGKLSGKYPALNQEKANEILVACKMCSSARASSDFGYAPATDITEGIRSTIKWYRDEGWL